MSLNFNAKTYECESAEVGAKDGQVVVTLVGNFPPVDQITAEEASSIVNTPLFHDLLRMAFQHAPDGTPVREAFDRMARDGGSAILQFKQLEIEVAA
jgi:hypothetical protein